MEMMAKHVQPQRNAVHSILVRAVTDGDGTDGDGDSYKYSDSGALLQTIMSVSMLCLLLSCCRPPFVSGCTLHPPCNLPPPLAILPPPPGGEQSLGPKQYEAPKKNIARRQRRRS